MKKSRNKQVAAILLILAIVITQIPPSQAQAETSDFVVDNTTLISYEGSERAVMIPNYIKTIGREAFENNGSLVSVQIPSSVTTIEAGAFAQCRNLSSVSIPSSVTKIAPSAFAGCDRLSSVSIDKNNSSYVCGNGTIMNADSSEIVQVLAGRPGDTYVVPSTAETIDRYSFWGCDNIHTVILNNRMTKIPAYAFSNMPNLEHVSMPECVSEIEMKAFENCTSLKELYLSPSVVRIHDTAFDGCRRLHISSVEGTVADRFYQNFTESNALAAEEEDGETGLFYEEPQERSADASLSGNAADGEDRSTQQRQDKDYSAANVDNAVYTDYTNGQDVLGGTKIVNGRAVIFVDNSKLQVYDKNSPPASAVAAAAPSTEKSAAGGQGEVLPEEESSALSEEIPNTKYVVVGDMIADRAFYKESSLDSYQIPVGIKRIGDFSFARSGLTSITIPSGVTEIGYGAFYSCENLANIVIPSTVTQIEPSAFEGTPWLERWRNGGNVSDYLIVGDGILIAYKGCLEHVAIPDGVKVIGPEVFQGHTEIRTVSIPESVKRIDEDAFHGCSSLENVSGGLSVEKIRDRAFYGCALQTVRVPESVTSIGLLAYGDMSQNDSVVFMGNTFPKLSYEKTATRLSNADYRRAPFDGVNVFVVPSSASVSSFEGTVLKDGVMGYQGVICSILREPTLQDKGEVSIRRVSHDQNGKLAAVPSSVWIYGKEYYVTNVEQNAYEIAQEAIDEEAAMDEDADTQTEGEASTGNFAGKSQGAGQTSNEDQGIGGQVSSESRSSDSQTDGRNEADGSVSENGGQGRSGNLSVRVKKSAWKEDTGIYADLTVGGEGYELTVADSESDALAAKLKEQGIQTDSFNFQDFDMRLVDVSSRIPITRLGAQRVTVCLPIASVYQNEPVVAVCLDSNGQPEYISCTHRKVGEQSYVLFDVKHFSTYGILCGDQVPQEYQDAYKEKVAAKKAAARDPKLGQKDESPDTGDPIHPKWFLAAGLAFLALFLFCRKPRRLYHAEK